MPLKKTSLLPDSGTLEKPFQSLKQFCASQLTGKLLVLKLLQWKNPKRFMISEDFQKPFLKSSIQPPEILNLQERFKNLFKKLQLNPTKPGASITELGV